jgi:hypothetical protein
VEFEPGQIYSANWDDDGTFRVAKVLVVDDEAVHVRVYKERFDDRPREVDTNDLSLGSVHDEGSFGVGHLPLAREEFLRWEPILIKSESVAEEELDGYEMWAEAPDAGVFGPAPTLGDRLRRLFRRRG